MPKRIRHEEYILATEKAYQSSLDQGKKVHLRNTIAGVLKASKPPQCNITKMEQRAIMALKRDDSIIIE